jgi:sterol desaturase/sphingolipid hydroxylase (fatty acid hydroxylase superfamily)
MHPLEHVIYFSTALVQWLIALHPINVLFQIHVAVVYAAFAHTGFERLMVGKRLGIDGGSYFHNLHHQHFECNYGGGLIPLDRVLGTFHDGSVESDKQLRERLRTRRKLLRQTQTN